MIATPDSLCGTTRKTPQCRCKRASDFLPSLLYDQKAVAVYLSLLALGVRNIRLGPTLPAYFSPHLIERLQREFGLRTIGNPRDDIALMMAGS